MTVLTAAPPSEQRFLLRNLDWSSYQAIANALGESHVRLTYDQGNLELMTLSHTHERWITLLDLFVVVLTEEMNMPRQDGGSTTFDRADLDRGLEPDRCYYLEHEPLVREKDQIDLTVDPPPDLALEIEISRSALNRMGIYAAMRVPEVWRFDGTTLRVFQLTAEGTYVAADRSRHFPLLPLTQVEAFLRRRGQIDHMNLVKSFRVWVREQIARGWQSPC
jgi:Uma2 family endonuclease